MDAVDDTTATLGGAVHQSDETASLLTIILDTHSASWEKVASPMLREAATAILVLINAHLALSNENRVFFISYDVNGPKVLYSSPDEEPKEKKVKHLEGTMYRHFLRIDEAVLSLLDAQLVAAKNSGSKPPCSLAGPLSLALCYTLRLVRTKNVRGRILVFSVSNEHSIKHIPIMNSIFAAQRLRIPIDVCKLSGDVTFLQQAADFTGGVFLRPEEPRGLVQYLLGAFLADPTTRQHLMLPTQQDVDFRAACFITHKFVDVGYVCSVCLCIMSYIPLTCPVCGITFPQDAERLPKTENHVANKI